MKLIDWYYKGLSQVVVEEAERTEFVNLTLSLRRHVLSSTPGKMVFRISKVMKNRQFFDSSYHAKDSDIAENSHLQVQEVLLDDESISPLWYIPHPSEIILVYFSETLKRPPNMQAKIGNEAPIRPKSHKFPAYNKTNIWKKSLDLHNMLFEIYSNIQMFASLIQVCCVLTNVMSSRTFRNSQAQ